MTSLSRHKIEFHILWATFLYGITTIIAVEGICDCTTCVANCMGSLGCKPGEFLVGNTSSWGCFECQNGHYCMGGQNASQVCPWGTFNNLTGQSDRLACKDCPVGHYCPTPGGSPVPCKSGFYSDSPKQIKCSICPEGYQCQSSSDKPIPCLPGQYSGAGNSTCSACRGGYECPNGTTPRECPMKTYSPLHSGKCLDCPAGFKCSRAGLSAPENCEKGFYNNATGQSACTKCEAGRECLNSKESVPCKPGYYSKEGEANCIPCPSGNYSDSSASFCLPCPAGKQCVDPSVPPVNCSEGYVSKTGDGLCTMCEPGTFSSSTRTVCYPCPAGYFCSDPRLSKVPCPAGMFSLGGSTFNCTACRAGTACPYAASTPVACTGATFSEDFATECKECPSGHRCPDHKSPEPCPFSQDVGFYYSTGNMLDCVKCPNRTTGQVCSSPYLLPRSCKTGEIPNLNGTECIPCRAGYYCAAPHLQEKECGTGEWSLVGASQCHECRRGFKCPHKDKIPSKCPLGWYASNKNSISCVQCPAGSYCVNTRDNPKLCVPGTFSSQGQTTCTNCPPGYECTNSSDPSSKKACLDGQYATGNKDKCTVCRAGYYCPSRRIDLEIPCPPGTYSDVGQSTCTSCPAGKMCPNRDNIGIRDCNPGEFSIGKSRSCTSCPRGFACPNTTSDYKIECQLGFYSTGQQVSCTPCSAGFYCPRTDKKLMIACDNGYFSLANSSRCTRCPPGYKCPYKNQDIQELCGNGTYSLGGQIECSPCHPGFACEKKTEGPRKCNPGYYSEKNSATCSLCKAGYQCSDPAVPEKCPTGTYSGPGSTLCQACAAGFICKEGSSSSTPSDGVCPSGGWCDGRTFNPCPPGTFNPFNGSSTFGHCKSCPPGFYCMVSSLDSYVNFICPAGHYCPSGTKYDRQFPCPAGTNSSATNQSTIEACKPCPETMYCPGGSAVGQICPAGYYCPEGTGEPRQYACPIGTFSSLLGLKNGSECTECPVGHYCPDGSQNQPTVAPVPCPPATYNPKSRVGYLLNCEPCPSGYACPRAGQHTYNDTCQEGYYCPNGTVSPSQYPCPPGTYTNRTDLTRAEECTPCPRGKSCGWGTAVTFNQWNVCKQGHYCPLGTPSPTKFPCPPGTYSNSSDLFAPEECTDCPAGSYCSGGEPTPRGLCPPGHYCPVRTRFAQEFPCPNRTYNLHYGKSQKGECEPCILGHFCEVGTVQPIPCPAGTYMPYGKNTSTNATNGIPSGYQSDCLPCTMGYYCLNATIKPYPCGKGKYSETGQSACQPCLAGRYCDLDATGVDEMNANKSCPAGKYCRGSLKDVGEAINCSKAHYCPKGTEVEIPCPAGTFNPDMNGADISACQVCSPGKYCLEKSEKPNGECNKGFYCPTNITNGVSTLVIGSYGPSQVPCPPKTYRNETSGRDVNDCHPCPEGNYCPEGSEVPIICPRGYYCPPRVSEPHPCRIGTFGNRSGLRFIEECRNCSKGWYCDAPGLPTPRGQCDAGYLCYGGAYTSTPTDGITGEVCPRGGFCTVGSFLPQPCPAGTYSVTGGATNNQDCERCNEGFYCASASNRRPDGPCNAGYYCGSGAITPNESITEPGYFTPEGASAPQPCLPGFYQPFQKQDRCKPCDSGYYCPTNKMTTKEPCPPGYYCPIGSHRTYECPPGTFNNYTRRSSLNDSCKPCPRGYYCQGAANIHPTGECSAGHICFERAEGKDPAYVEGKLEWGKRCEPGHYCEQGATYEVPCPEGTYRATSGGQSVNDCDLCNEGYFCNGTGRITVSGKCSAGYYCKRGSRLSTPNNGTFGGQCPIGHYCEEGTISPQPCSVGYYADEPGLSQCKVCPSGKYCPKETVTPQPCVQGFFCLSGDDNRENGEPVPCPRGTFGNRDGLKEESQCSDCSPGRYCDQEGLRNVSGLCASGYWCKRRAITDSPGGGDDYGACPPGGYYCEEGSSAPQRCPAGRYARPGRDKLKSANECDVCPPGYYCAYGNQTQPTGTCAPGYYCVSRSPVREPLGDVYGGKCFPGYKCPEGSSYPEPCEAGTYNNETGRSSCLDCPPGFFCTMNTTVPVECPSGYYCPINSKTATAHPCPAGTFNNLTARSALQDCQPCTPGSYCDKSGLSAVAGLCDGGYFCMNRSISKTPGNLAEGGGPCTPGTYCPRGTPLPIQCPPGKICTSNVLSSPDGECFPGFYCTGGANVGNPSGGVVGDRCPLGAYCPRGSRNYTLCPPGTYSNTSGNVNESHCYSCTAGKYCKDWGNSGPTDDCDEGFFCPPGQAIPQPNNYMCPEGHYCPKGSSQPRRCKSGEYQDEKKMESCKVCPAGYYCDNRHEAVVLFKNSTCPVGHYCPEGTKSAYEFKCPRGTFSNETGLKNVTQCSPCPGGFYCPELGQSTFSLRCSGGYYCRSGAYVATPEGYPENTTICLPGSFNFSDAGPCPPSRFCPYGTGEPEKCPPGTFSSQAKLQSKDQCNNCTEGMFCKGYGLKKPTGKCWGGYYCPSGADRPDFLECPAGSYCVNGSVIGELCPNGTYRNETRGKSLNDCFSCTPGRYCDGIGLKKPSGLCGVGYYCPSGSKYVKPPGFQCPVGHYCPGGVPEPIPCRNNSYVNYTGAVRCEPCPAGFYCVIAGTTVICPEGYYCPAGTGKDLKSCPRGTYGPEKGYYEVSQCKPCKAGMYCGYEHMVNVTTKCAAGHWCAYGVDRPKPFGRNSSDCNRIDNTSCPHFDGRETGLGGICPLGSYCPEGSPWPIRCKTGTYAPQTGLSKCKECMEGYYCPENQSSFERFPCPRGYYCPNGTKNPYDNPCKPGTYNNEFRKTKEEDCISCRPGYYCPQWGMIEPNQTCSAGYFCRRGAVSGTPNQGENANICPQGHYCLNRTGEPSKCPSGTLNNQTGLKKAEECQSCPPGYYCSEAGLNVTSGPCAAGYYCPPGSDSEQEKPCPIGRYCPMQSKQPILCPVGTYQPNERQVSVEDCLPCTEGFFCATPGLANYSGTCANGSFCPVNSTSPTPYDCPPGFHCPEGSARPKPCPPGRFTNFSSASQCEVCPEGYFCLPLTWTGTLSKNVSKGYHTCLSGFYCPKGTGSNLRPCRAGTFSNQTGLYLQSQCTDCTPGFYCDGSNLTTPTGPCDPGYYCTSGVSIPKPFIDTYNITNGTCPSPDFLGQYTGIGNICPTAHYCPGQTDRPKACPAGTYNDVWGQSECKRCPAGYFCLSLTENFVNNTCPTGYYCPNNTRYARQYPCPEGTYNSMTEQRSKSSCLPCSLGMYCEGNGLSEPTGPCSEGWYCNGSATTNMTTVNGGKCQPGYYCPSGSHQMLPCRGGSYCATSGLPAPTGNCTAGYYCTLGASVSTPNDGITGKRCSPGYYCPSGSSHQVPCEPGYYLDSPGATNKFSCKLCPLGKFCNSTGLSVPSGNCSSGFYCPSGQSTITPVNYSCPVGHYCLEGDSKPRPCPSGFYQDLPIQSSCKLCPERFYCNATHKPVVNYNLYLCPEGYYCPNGTTFAKEFPCDIGTFNNLTGRASQAECTACLGRYYCGHPGLTYPNTFCAAGFFCIEGATKSTPTQGNAANICPPGYFCPEGTDFPQPCPAGTFSNISGLQNSFSCTPCTEGSYCQYPGWTNLTGVCEEGSYCPKYSTSSKHRECPYGSYCPKGSARPTLCPRGTFSNNTGRWTASQCTNCTAGYFCDSEGRSSPTGECKAGYFCPERSKVAEAIACPIGFHCPTGSKTPRDCPSGLFTNTTRASVCQQCTAGYYCTPVNVTAGDPLSGYHLCPKGYYCPSGTGLDWKPCPRGSYSNSTGLSKESQCLPCDSGYYCDMPGSTKPRALCHGGYYCESGVDRPNPIHAENVSSSLTSNCSVLGYHTGVGGVCPPGYYCPSGTVTPKGCSPGTYQDEVGKTYCKSCPAGYYCLSNSSSYISNLCPEGHYCVENTTMPMENPCPPGTFNSKTTQTSRLSCRPCTPGMYCEGFGNPQPTNNCSAGWYCSGGANSSQPSEGKCLRGYYCPSGSSAPKPCDPGYYCLSDLLSTPTHECEAGWYCGGGSSEPQPTDNITGNICPVGNYCPRGSRAPRQCPVGTFLNTTGNRNITDCQDCIYGWYCGGSGLSSPTSPCQRGYYCDGKATKSDWKACPKGYSCSGRDHPRPCNAGYYQDQVAQFNCTPCPAGYYCNHSFGPITHFTVFECPAGYYCPERTEYATKFPCPLGTFNNLTKRRGVSDCIPCIGGFACDEPGVSSPYKLCSAGYFCKRWANSTTPNLGNDANVCPPGYFCPEGTDEPRECPIGTLRSVEGGQSVDDCKNCTGGEFCNGTAMTTTSGPCDPGFYCLEGSSNSQQFICPQGSYCERGTFYPKLCEAGTFSNSTMLKSSSDCTSCTSGSYCESTGLKKPSGACQEGYYCPRGSSNKTAFECPIGTHCPVGSGYYKHCPAGLYTDYNGASTCHVCPERYFCVPERVVRGDVSTVKIVCPAGYYCPNGTGWNWRACPPGTYSNRTGLGEEKECTPCDAGMFCAGTNLTKPTGRCEKGYYCVRGAAVSNPLMTNLTYCPAHFAHVTIGDICPRGHFCPEGSEIFKGCEPGTYNDEEGQETCKTCPSGYYCLANTTSYIPYPCPKGYYCPTRTPHPNYRPCPYGTFNDKYGGQNKSACQDCTPGYYCSGWGSDKPTAPCSAGWYCPGGNNVSTPSTSECQQGFYCPVNSSRMTPCDEGRYCPAPRMAMPGSFCDAGYYCPLGSYSSRQEDCPPGNYCPTGSKSPLPCDPGTYLPGKNHVNKSECSKCSPGMFCNQSGLAEPSDYCEEKYYCPAGQILSRPVQYFCPQGHFCKSGFAEPQRCGNGSYQPNNFSTSCLTCEAGYFCDNTYEAVADLTGLECPAGHYCPRGTKFATEFPCLPGTWSNVTKLVRADQCFQCPLRYYCQNSGLRKPQDFCYAGYYCNKTGTRIPNPPDGGCPRGYYCPRGSYLPIPCPRGSYTNSTRNGNVSDCKPCSPGKYCDPNAGVMQERDCSPGFVCLIGSTVPNPVNGSQGYQCPKGHYCPAGTVKEKPCPFGTYGPEKGLAACIPCPLGKICPNYTTIVPLPCPAGRYCKGGDSNGEPCPTGTYRRDLSARFRNECLPCDPGTFCGRQGLDKPSGPCLEGYLCLSGAISVTPNDPVNKRCPKGKYCVNGTTHGELCPEGTMRNAAGAAKLDDCMPCEAGKYCNQSGLFEPSGDCEPGYYCPGAARIKDSKPDGFLCPSGHYCPRGTAHPKGCEPGLYQPNIGNDTCFPCPPGKFCLGNTSIPENCPAHKYCPGSTAEPLLCPNGTYTDSSTSGLSNSTQCSPCTPGHFCQRGEISGKCSAGYLCYRGNPTPTPDGADKTVGELCPYGFYCPAGAIDKVACSRGLVIDMSGAKSAADCALCPAGKICSENNTLAVPCTIGFYCPYNATMKPCLKGTYSNTAGATNSSTCKPCPAGYWCNREAMSNFKTSPCPVGYFCNEATIEPIACPENGTYRNSSGAASIEECFECPRGFYCPDNSTVSPIACLNGTFCPPGSVQPRICQPGFYCRRSMYQEPCPAGFYCPRGMSYPLPCPMGYYCDPALLNGTGVIKPTICPKGYEEILGSHRRTLNDTCQICKPGYFNDDPSANLCRKCKAGFICFEGAITDEPLGNSSKHGVLYTKSFPCPRGYYCESGDTTPRPCPNATYNPDERGSRRENCLPCGVDHYNHLTGQSACFHCGGQARQPYLGQDKCQCNGLHRVFMPSDQTCLCAKGFRAMDGRELDCVRKLYPICKEGYWRSQKGDCLNTVEWGEYCTSQVCGEGRYVGFDRQLGLCTCKVDDLEEVCDTKCRREQKNRLEVVCSNEPYLRINQDQGSPAIFSDLESFGKIPNFLKTFSKDQCPTLDKTAYPFNLVEMGENGFLGTYNPPADFIIETLNENKNDVNTTSSPTTPSSRRRRSLLALSTLNSSLIGISNPTTCLSFGSSMLFLVNNDNYPEYDENNLYNTNPNFDYGPFRDLKERHSLMSTSSTLFAFRFDAPGVYAFRSSKYQDLKMYVRVMARGAQCAEDGPFFSTTPRAVIQNGIAVSQDILIMPDWLLIGMMMASLVLLMIVLVIGLLVFRKHGWRKIVLNSPKYRKLNNQYNFDDYSSKGSAVHPSKKLHRNFYVIDGAPASALEVETSQTGIDNEMKSDEFWDYEKQVDLEAFSSNEFYSILSKQSRDVTSSIARQKDQAKELYQKVSQQTESLRGLWVAKLNLRGRSSIASPEDLQVYEYKRKELDGELERRKELGFTFQQIIRKELDILNEDEKSREAHQISFTATMVEAIHVLNDVTESTSQSTSDTLRPRMSGKMNALLQRMTVEVTSECQRRGAWGLLGQTTGAQLCTLEGDVLHYSHIFDADGKLLSDEFVREDPHTGLFVPTDGAVSMMLADNLTITQIPASFFVHPKTGKVMPIEGNVLFDPVSSRLVVTADSSNDDAGNLNETPIPYIPYPINPLTGKPVKNHFIQPAKLNDIKFGGPTNDPKTGLYAPTLGVTIHPETGAVYPVGGCQDSPVTGLPVPIEVGSMMFDPKTDQPVPVIAVTIDSLTGYVIPVGGNITNSGKGEEVPMIMGELYVEPLSGNTLKVTGARIIDDGQEKELESMGGGYLNALDVCELYHESRVIDALRDWKRTATGSEPLSGRHEKSILEMRVKELGRAKVKVKTQLLRRLHGVSKREEQANILMESGGCPGMYEYYATGQLLPILVGTTMKDVSGSGLEVPILGIDRGPGSKEIMPLGGSVEDPHGNGLVPIMLGEKAVDPVTNEMSTICGVKLNKDLNITEPVTLSSSSKKKRKAHPASVAMLEEEHVARKSFWRRQRHREREISEYETSLAKLIIQDQNVTLSHVSERLELIDEGISSLSEAEHREIQRRGDASIEQTASLPAFVLHWITKLDIPEREREETQHAAHIKFVDTIQRFFNKLQAEETRYRARMDELEGALNPDAEATVTERYHQLKARLRSEVEDQLQSRMEQLDEEHAALEYVREKAELLLSEAKNILGGSGTYAGDFDGLMVGVYGDDLQHSDTNSELVPLLKRLISLLQESGSIISTTRSPGHYPPAKDSESRASRLMVNKGQTSLPFSNISYESPAKEPWADTKAISKERSETFVPAVPAQETKPTMSADQMFADLTVSQLGETFSGGEVSVSEIAATGEWTEEKQKQIGKNLREKHALEYVQVENELRANEIRAIKEVLEKYENRKGDSVRELGKELREKLRSATSDEEKEFIIEDYSSKMEETVYGLENQKQEKLKDVRKLSKRERLRKKKDLYNRHKEEARKAGFEHVLDLDLPSDDELEKDLIQLAKEQEKLISELKQAYAEEEDKLGRNIDAGRKAKFDTEMEALAKAMSSSVPATVLENAIEVMREVSSKVASRGQDMKEKMRAKREKRRAKSGKGVPLTTDEQEALESAEAGSELEARIIESGELRQSSSEKYTDDAILMVLSELEEKELKDNKTKIINNLLDKTEMTEDEKMSALSRFMAEAEAANEKFSSIKNYNQAVLAAKLAARKRMKEDLARDKAMKDEVAALAIKQVNE